MNSNTVNSADQTVLPSADQTVLPSADQTVLPAETKKKPVLKTIPKKIMGYLKFAHFVLGSNDDTIVSKLFLDKSIDQIVAIVNDVVENGNQDKTINDLRKLIFNPPKLKNPKKTKGDVERVLRRAVANLLKRVGLTTGARRVARLTALHDKVR